MTPWLQHARFEFPSDRHLSEGYEKRPSVLQGLLGSSPSPSSSSRTFRASAAGGMGFGKNATAGSDRPSSAVSP